MTTHSIRTPSADRARLALLSSHLSAIGFTEEGIREALGGAASPDPWSFGTRELREEGTALSAVAKLFCFGVPVEHRQAASAFGPLSLSDLEDLRLVEIGNDLVRPLCIIRPANGLFVASDIPSSDPEVVLGAVPASETLARLTVRRKAARGFDLGTGCGVQALLLARHASAVTAVDVNPRALAFARFNAALNEMTNVDVRQGSWFGPVEDERFDVIACNPPFVVSPDTAYTFRDGGMTRDRVSQMVVRESARHLADGGFATILCNWIHDGDWAGALRPWIADTGCDALLLHYATIDPVSYAMRWNADVQKRDPRAFEATVRRWLDYFRGEGIERIAFGGVVLRRREGAASHWVRALEMVEGPGGSCSDQILRLFDAADFLDSPAARDLFGHAFTLADNHTIDQTLRFTEGKYTMAPAIFRCVPGIGLEAPVDARALEVLLECKGDRTLGALADATAADRCEPAGEVRALVDQTVRQLVERGFMVPVNDNNQGEQAW